MKSNLFIGTGLLCLGIMAGCLDPSAAGNLVPKTVDEDPSLPRLALRDTTVHLETFGKKGGPVVIMLHGGPGVDYRGMLPLSALADDGYFVVFWDQRGTGLSRRHDCADITADAYRKDLEAIVDLFARSPTDRVSMVGRSWGAMYATLYTNEHPDRVARLVLAEPGAFTQAELDAWKKRLMSSLSLTSETFNDAAFFKRFLTPDDHARADFQRALDSTIIDEPLGIDPAHGEPFWRQGAVTARCLPENAENFDFTANLSRYTDEVLFLHGELNRVHTLESQLSLAAHYPHAHVVTIPGVGHDMMTAAPEQVLTLVRAQLAGVK
jgi:proline iminopeptidase